MASSAVAPLKVLVAGGSGFVGGELVNQLSRRGHSVHIVGRGAKRNTQRSVTHLSWDDLLAKDSIKEYDAVVNVSGQNVLNPYTLWSKEYKAGCIDSRVETTLALAQLITLSPKPPKVFIATSAIGIYPPGTSQVFDETTPLVANASPNGKDFPRWLTTSIEQAAKLPADMRELKTSHFALRPTLYQIGLKKAATAYSNTPTEERELKTDTVRSVIIRLGVVLGRGGGAFQMQRLPFSLGLGGRMGDGSQYMPWIHLHDAAGIYVHAIENPEVSGVLNAVAPEMITNADYTSGLARALNRPAFMHAPAFAVNLMFGGPERSVMLLEGQKVQPKRTLESGFHFKFPKLDATLKDLV